MNPIIENDIIYIPKRATQDDSTIIGDGYVPLKDVSEEEQQRWYKYMKSIGMLQDTDDLNTLLNLADAVDHLEKAKEKREYIKQGEHPPKWVVATGQLKRGFAPGTRYYNPDNKPANTDEYDSKALVQGPDGEYRLVEQDETTGESDNAGLSQLKEIEVVQAPDIRDKTDVKYNEQSATAEDVSSIINSIIHHRFNGETILAIPGQNPDTPIKLAEDLANSIKERATEDIINTLDGIGMQGTFPDGKRGMAKWQLESFKELYILLSDIGISSDAGLTMLSEESVNEATDGRTASERVLGITQTGLATLELYNAGKYWHPNVDAAQIKKDQQTPGAYAEWLLQRADQRSTIVHEIAHSVFDEGSKRIPAWIWGACENLHLKALESLAQDPDLSQFSSVEDALGWTDGVPTYFERKHGFPSAYSVIGGAHEFIAECFKFHLIDTDFLEETNPEMFELLEMLNSTHIDEVDHRPATMEELQDGRAERFNFISVFSRITDLIGDFETYKKEQDKDPNSWETKRTLRQSTALYKMLQVRIDHHIAYGGTKESILALMEVGKRTGDLATLLSHHGVTDIKGKAITDYPKDIKKFIEKELRKATAKYKPDLNAVPWSIMQPKLQQGDVFWTDGRPSKKDMYGVT